jgi:hypothetical protein
MILTKSKNGRSIKLQLNIAKRRLARPPTALPGEKSGNRQRSKFFGKKEMSLVLLGTS